MSFGVAIVFLEIFFITNDGLFELCFGLFMLAQRPVTKTQTKTRLRQIRVCFECFLKLLNGRLVVIVAVKSLTLFDQSTRPATIALSIIGRIRLPQIVM